MWIIENRYIITLDLKGRVIGNIKFKQGDINSAILEVHLIANSKAVPITGEIIEFRFCKQDKTLVYQDIGTNVTILDGPNGIVECALMANTLSFPGIVKCEIHRKKDGKELTTSAFNFTVESSIGAEGTLSFNYISSIENKIIGLQIEFNKNEAIRKADFNTIKTEYGTYKGVMIAESNVAALQNNININAAQLANIPSLLTYGGQAIDSFDNFTAIQQAFQSGKKVTIPKGTYNIKTEQTINIASNTEIIFAEGAEIIIDTGFVNVMGATPFKILPDSYNITLKNFNAKGYKPPTQRLGADGFLRIENAKNIRLEGKTRIENANTTCLHIVYTDGIYIEDFYGKQCNADGVFIRFTKNIKAGIIKVENTGDDGLSIAYDATVNSEGGGTYDIANCCENVDIDVVEVNGMSPYSFAPTCAGLFVISSKNVHIGKLIVTGRTIGFRTTIGHNTSVDNWGGLYNKNIRIDSIYANGITDKLVHITGYVTDSFDKSIFDMFIKIGSIYMDSCTASPLNIASFDVNVSYIAGMIDIGSITVVNSTSTTGFVIGNIKNVNIGYIYAPTISMNFLQCLNCSLLHIHEMHVSNITVNDGCIGIKIDKAFILNAITNGLYCNSTVATNNLEIKYLEINGFNTSSGVSIRGIRLSNTVLKCDTAYIYYYNTTVLSGVFSIFIVDNVLSTFGNVYSKWTDGTDDGRYESTFFTKVKRIEEYNYVNGSNVAKAIKFNRSGTTALRPTTNLYVGYPYQDITLGVPLYYTGSVWKRYDTNATV